MKQIGTYILALLMILTLLPGCTEEETLPAPIGSQYWEHYPSLAANSLNSDPLTVQSWNCGRLEATSYETMAETETGYYLVYMNRLFYADKTDLANWVPICNQPDCKHTEAGGCPSFTLSERIVVKDNRIFTTVNSGTYPEIYNDNFAVVVMSFLGNGTDPKLEYVLEEGVYHDSAAIHALLYSDQMLYNSVALQRDGSWIGYLYRVTPEGVQKLAEVENFDRNGLVISTPTEIVNGVNLFQTTLLDSTGRIFYYYENGILKNFDILSLPGVGGYLSNGTIRYMNTGDGYYDLNLETGEKTFLEKSRMENSKGQVLLPNCIIETTLIGNNTTQGNVIDELHKMELYDGNQWKTVTLPRELENSNENLTISIMGVASDRILIACRDSRYQTAEYGYCFSVYQILLDAQDLALTYCADISLP